MEMKYEKELIRKVSDDMLVKLFKAENNQIITYRR